MQYAAKALDKTVELEVKHINSVRASLLPRQGFSKERKLKFHDK